MRLRGILILFACVVLMGGVFLVTRRPSTEPSAPPRPFVWSVNMDDLRTVAISLAAEHQQQLWVKGEDGAWHFDRVDGPAVDEDRWGGGIPLLLSAGRADRLIAADATPKQLADYGLASPAMQVELTLADARSIEIDVGDSTPDSGAYYVKLADSPDVYSLDESWKAIVENLVLKPPLADPAAGKSVSDH